MPDLTQHTALDPHRITDAASAAAYVKSIPTRYPGGGGHHWRDDPDGVALVAAFLLSQPDPRAACRALGTATGSTGQAFEQFIVGHDASSSRWPALRERLQALGVAWIPDAQERDKRSRAAATVAKPQPAPASPPKSAVAHPDFAAASKLIRDMPRGDAGRLRWQDNFADCLAIVRAILSAAEPRVMIEALVTATKCRIGSLRNMAMGQTPGGNPWPRLRKHIRQCGLQPLVSPSKRPTRPATPRPATSPTTAAPTAPAASVPPADKPRAASPPPLPAAASKPPSIREHAWRVMPETDDVEVVEIRLLKYGTPEHRAFVRAHLAAMGTARP